MNNFIELNNIKKSFKDGKQELRILKGININIEEQEIVAILGPSGAGKSTLLHIIGGLNSPTEGSVKIDNMDIYSYNGKKISNFRNNYIGFIFQFHHLLPEFNALENVAIPLLIRRENFKHAKERAKTILVKLGLEERLLHKPNEMSGGEQQRVSIARAMVTDPRVILADEPTGNLDKENSKKVQELLITLSKEKKQTVIIVTHNEGLAGCAHRMIKLIDGQIDPARA
ncbi:ABC transporter ATP-binding protein [Candidatus Desantisbacteria bacterium]|nr:ABC transporter ATP-binding protein [Candidatus Desantisbacteria bacterium]